MERLKQYLLDLFTKGRHETYEMDVIRQIMLLNIGTALGIVVLVLFGTMNCLHAINNIGLIDYALAILLFFILLYARQSQNYRLGLYLAIGFFTPLCFYLLFSGGAYQTGYVWYFTYPLIACFGLGARKGAVAMAILIVPTLILFALDHLPNIIVSYPFNFKIRFVSAFLIVAAMAYIAERIREATYAKLEAKNAELNEAISELKVAEEMLIQESDTLEKRVEERTKQLSDANRQLTEEIKERKRVEGTLRENEQIYRWITENMTDVITVFDMNLGIVYLSPSSQRIRGFTVEEVKTQTA